MTRPPRFPSRVRRVASGTPWEDAVGYCRALRVGRFVFVSGTTATGPDGSVEGEGDPYRQAFRALTNLKSALGRLGASLRDVVRTRMYVTRIEDWKEIGRAHREFFGAHPPVTTMVEISRLIDPAMRVEIEADAIVAPPRRGAPARRRALP